MRFIHESEPIPPLLKTMSTCARSRSAQQGMRQYAKSWPKSARPLKNTPTGGR